MDYEKYKVQDSTEISVGTMYCIGQNYAKHAAEMGGTKSQEPMVFIKPPSAFIPNGSSVRLPDFSTNVHHEVELVVLIGEDCHNIEINDAYKYIAGYAVGVDVTLRDIQQSAKNSGKPWAVAKGFHTSAPISEFVPQSTFGNEIPFFGLKLWINDELKQYGNTKDMERSVGQLIKYIAGVFTLRRGDIIFTGTPEGVGQIRKGDRINAELEGFVTVNVGVE